VLKSIFSIFLLLCFQQVHNCSLAQNKVSKDFTLQKNLKQDGLEYKFTVLSDDKHGVFHYDLKRTYFWYKAQKVMSTQGSASGILLHGDFVAYHPNRQLAQKGKFRRGLKCGKWLYWNDKGECIKVEKWRKGKEIKPRKEGKVAKESKERNRKQKDDENKVREKGEIWSKVKSVFKKSEKTTNTKEKSTKGEKSKRDKKVKDKKPKSSDKKPKK
jgi:hypothetical protein